MNKFVLLLINLVIFSLLLTACNFPLFMNNTPSTVDLVNTAAAQTVQALGTQMATESPSTQIAFTPGTTVWPTITQMTQVPPTPDLQDTKEPESCDEAKFIDDVTVPDGMVILPGTPFTKVWKILNEGDCTWDSRYDLVFASEGHAMSGKAAQSIGDLTVDPGATGQISIDLVAPNSPGTYRGVWRLRNPSGETFGKFWVQIKVEEIKEGAFEFADHVCSAVWRNGSDAVSCPGVEGNEDGFAFRVDTPRFEGGYQDDEPAILMSPQAVNDGVIIGKFVPIKVPDGAHFRTVIGCRHEAENCNVQMTVKYQVEGESEKILGEWDQLFDDQKKAIEIDLAALGLNGKTVSFTFIVKANGSPEDDYAFWLRPRIN
jgi:hypothetical protein